MIRAERRRDTGSPTAEASTETVEAVAEYRRQAARIQDLLDFYLRETGDWTAVDVADPARGQALRETYHRLERTQKLDPAYKDAGLSLAGVASAVIERFKRRADELETTMVKPPVVMAAVRVEQPRRVEQAREQFFVAELFMPNEVAQQWQILRVNPRRRTYIIGRTSDRRSPSDIISDVISGTPFQGATAGYELSWEEFERYSQTTNTKLAAAGAA